MTALLSKLILRMTRPWSIVIEESSDGQFYFKVIAGQGEPTAVSEMYTRPYDAQRAANQFKRKMANARVECVTQLQKQ